MQGPGVIVTETSYSTGATNGRTGSISAMAGITRRGPVNRAVLITSLAAFVNVFGGAISGSNAYASVKLFFDNGGTQLYFTRIAHYSDIADSSTLTAVKSSVTIGDRTAVAATLNTGTVGVDRIVWTAKTAGTGGNSISITMTAAGNNTPLSVSVNSSAITVALATNGSAESTSTVAQVLAAVAASTAASTLVTATSSATGTVAAAIQASLSGGSAATDSIKVTAANEGTWGDDVSVEITNGTTNPSTEFNLVLSVGSTVVKTFANLSLDESATNYVENVSSTYITVEDKTTGTKTANMRPAVGTYSLTGGDDGLTSLSDDDYIGSPVNRTGLFSFDEIQGLCNVAVPGVTSVAFIAALLSYCSNYRKDIACVVDSPYGLLLQDIIDFRMGQGAYSHATFNSSHGALCWPWGNTGNGVFAPPSGAVLGRMSALSASGSVCDAVIGPENGKLTGFTALEYNPSDDEIGIAYSYGVNCLQMAPDGLCIMGQKTLQTHESSTDRMNSRQLFNLVKRTLRRSMRTLIGKPNNQKTWAMARRIVEPFMRTLVALESGPSEFRFICDETTNTPEMQQSHALVSKLAVKPTPTSEWVYLDIMDIGATVSIDEVFAAE